MYLILAWKIRLEAKDIALMLSHHNVGGDNNEIPRSCNNILA